MRVTNALRQLIRTGSDSERTLRSESRRVDASRARVLVRIADDCGTSVELLRAAQVGPRRDRVSGSWLELLRELARGALVMAGGPNGGDAVASCRRSMRRVEALYDRAVALHWPEETLALLIEQRRSVQQASADLTAIRF